MFGKIKHRRIFEVIASRVRDAILNGSLKPGEKLPSEDELAASFGVGRPAVREALRTLEIAGLVTVRHGKQGGAYVQDGDMDSLRDHFSDLLRLGKVSLQHLTEARLFMETLMFDIMADKITPKHIKDLRQCIASSDEMFRLGKEEERITENFYFHILLASITQNPVISINVSTINDLMRFFLVKIKPTKQVTRNTIDAHSRIVDLLEAGDLEGAKEINRKHITDVTERLVSKYSAGFGPRASGGIDLLHGVKEGLYDQ
jgi:GntR family transcriptional repressor for pyruvate dehydrogenase complex